MQSDRRSVLGALTALPLLGNTAPRPVTIFEAASIITMEPSLPRGKFLAVADGLVLGVEQTLDDLRAWTSGGQVRFDRQFAGKTIMPGLVEPHIHPIQAAVMLNLPFIAPDDWDLPTGRYPGVRGGQQWRERLKEELARSQEPLFICWGYHNLFHGVLDRAELDKIAPDRPVVVWQRSFHEVILNTKALEAWGFPNAEALEATRKAFKADPVHVDYARGHFSETGLMIALAKMRPVILSEGRITRGLAALRQMLRSKGVTTASDMATGIFSNFDTEAKMIATAFGQPGGGARIMLMPTASQLDVIADPVAWLNATKANYSSRRVRIDKRVKLLADGAFFAQNMRMNAPGYADGHVGKWITAPDVLLRQIKRYGELGFHLHIHVNGDEGLDTVLDALATLPRDRGQTITLEHLGYSTEAQNRRIAAMDLMVSAQPNYIRVLGEAYAREGLGAERAYLMNRLGSLERKGVPLGLHSDFNMAPVDPFYLAWIAANRITLDGKVRGEAERLTLDKALRAITIEAAQVIGMDATVGSLSTGKKADFIAVDRDPYKTGVASLKDIHVEALVFEGEVIGNR